MVQCTVKLGVYAFDFVFFILNTQIMVQYCVVPGCKNSALSFGISFHQFPRNEEVKKVWIAKIQQGDPKRDFKVSEYMRVCSAHFLPSDFTEGLKNKWLNKSAVPSVFSFTSPKKIEVAAHHITRSSIDQDLSIPVSYKFRNLPDNMPGCSAFGCTNRSEKGFLMKKFPRDPVRRAIWAAKLNRENWTPSPHSFLCEVHFQSDQWERVRIDGQRKLKHDAVPTIFSHQLTPKTKKHPTNRFPQPKKLKTEIESNEDTFDTSCSSNYDHSTGQGKMLEAIKYDGITLDVLDQLLLPHKTRYENVLNVDEGWQVIRSMKVTGARAVSIVGALSLAVELKSPTVSSKNELHNHIKQRLEYLVTARPTCVNLRKVANSTVSHSLLLLEDEEVSVREMNDRIVEELEQLLKKDISFNESIGLHGGMHISSNAEDLVTILTHCNTGSLTTAGYGTALGVIRWLHEQKRLSHVYFTETRPCNQGARLTSYELVLDQIPATLICDSMVSALLQTKKITAVVVGADIIAANGDIANEIGTYQIAISAQYHGIPFYVASPTSKFDTTLENGSLIPMEERPNSETTMINSQWIDADGIIRWNPAFDITPAELITGGIITEYGVFPASSLKKLKESFQAL